MSALLDAQPWWIGHGSLPIVVLVACLCYPCARFVLAPLVRDRRAAKNAHWTERARLGFSVRSIAGTAAVYLGAGAMVAGGLLTGPLSRWSAPSLVLLCGAMAAGATYWAYVDATRGLVRPRSGADRARTLAWHVSMKALPLYAAITAFLLPAELGPWSVGVWIAGVIVVWSPVPGWLLAATGVVVAAPERAVAALKRASERVGVQPRGIKMVRISESNAWALVLSRTVLVTQGATEVLDDDELAAVFAHELGHLAESRGAVTMRVAAGSAWLPLSFIYPITMEWGLLACLGVLASIYLLRRLFLSFSRRMERRADEHARLADPLVHARALTVLHEHNQIPAVFGNKTTHPSLFDRLVALGAEPDYPRPEAPVEPASGRMAVSIVVGLLAFVLFTFGVRSAKEDAVSVAEYLAIAAVEGGSTSDLAALAARARGAEQRLLYVTAWASSSAEASPAFDAAILHAEVGRCDEASEWLEEASARQDAVVAREDAALAVESCEPGG